VLVLASSVALAQQIGFKRVGGGIGYTSVSFSSGVRSETLGGFAISGHAYLGEITSGIGFYPEVLYWHTSKDFGAGLTWSVNDFVINANAHYNIKVRGKVSPYVGAGLGLNFLRTSIQVIDQRRHTTREVTGSETRLGVSLLGGADYAMNSRLRIGGELRYVLASDYNHLLIQATFTYALR
jgi:opacity protein-like surface antigen